MYKAFFKRVLDLIIGIIAFPFFCLAFIIFGPIIKLTDRGPIFYNAQRIGKNGKLFKMYKFRSMYVNSPDIRNADGSTFNGKNDARVTRIGKIMRETSIDEIPQVLNIINGSMSLIGPRPDPPDDMLIYTEEEKKKLTVRPGLTGYNQAYYRNSIEQKVKFANDVFYAQNISFSLDMKILFRTVIMVISHKDVYTSIPTLEDNNTEKQKNV